MLKTIAVDKKGDILTDVSLERLKEQDIAWYWVDFDTPSRSEINLLTTFFKFHELIIEDCYKTTNFLSISCIKKYRC